MTVKTDYGALAARYDRRYEENRYDGIEAIARARAGAGLDVLEVGCGTGHWLARLESLGCRSVGVDPTPQMRERARARGVSASLLNGRAEALPFEDARFDLALCVDAVDHFGGAPRAATRWDVGVDLPRLQRRDLRLYAPSRRVPS